MRRQEKKEHGRHAALLQWSVWMPGMTPYHFTSVTFTMRINVYAISVVGLYTSEVEQRIRKVGTQTHQMNCASRRKILLLTRLTNMSVYRYIAVLTKLFTAHNYRIFYSRKIYFPSKPQMELFSSKLILWFILFTTLCMTQGNG